ncbi:hypothetical protein Cantr_02066 [Candida viswanathii]|uniref:Uncharacterized protein n=1 Tax=Candida viswanathii TaxID=5486 RepID=A0A367YKN1_9ASCO|nr:hypothetical protein Cantr_02066 [Candida viswanathii]
MPSERPLDVPGLSAPEELSLPLAKDRDLRETGFSELPRATVGEFEPSRLSAPEQPASPFRVHHDPSDAASSELPRVAVIHFCVESEDQSREQEWSRLSAPEELTSPVLMDHHLPDAVDDVDGNEKITDPFRSRTRMVSIKRPRRANFTAFDGLPPIRHRIFRITSIPGQRPLCGELQPDCKSTMPSERPVDVHGLSAPEELSLPLESHRDLCDTAFSELPRAPV